VPEKGCSEEEIKPLAWKKERVVNYQDVVIDLSSAFKRLRAWVDKDATRDD
jgi:hypothetical protein